MSCLKENLNALIVCENGKKIWKPSIIYNNRNENKFTIADARTFMSKFG